MAENAKNIVLDPDMSSPDLDKITLTDKQKRRGIPLFIICSIIGVLVFFGSLPTGDGDSEVIFSLLYNGFTGLFGVAIYWIVFAIIFANFCLHVYFKYIKKNSCNSMLADVYKNDKVLHTVLYFLGGLYVFLYALKETTPFPGFEMITGDATGGNVIPPVVVGVLGIMLVGAFAMPMLLNYGVMAVIGAILEPLMRPLFKIPGKAALDAVTSFVSSSSLGVMITNRLWKQGVYTDKEMVSIMTGFSAVSIGFAYMVIDTAGCSDQFVKIYALSFIMVFIMAFIMIRIPPISRKPNRYFSGREQTEADLADAHYTAQTFPRGFVRGVKRAGISRGPVKDILLSLRDNMLVMPQVLTMLSAIGVTAMILAEYTPIFTWVGYIFQPLLMLCGVPDASMIAASMPIGLAEMFLPVLLLTKNFAVISYEARAFVCLVSMVQIIFFSETASVMLATKSPIKFSEIIICFIERTIIAIPLSAICIHLFF